MDSLNFSSFHDPVLDILAQYFPCSLKKYCFVDGKTDDGKLEKKLLDAKIIFGRKSWETPRLVGKLLVLYDTINGH